MILGDERFFTKEHCESQRGVAPAHLCELVVYCLELVSQLSKRGLSYRFKGGNSQLILLQDPQRFSIDVDIVTTESKEKLISIVEEITAECELFRRVEVRQHKTKPWLPMISFNLFFDSHFQAADDAFVMLDAVLEEPAYSGVVKPVQCGALYASAETVEVPTVSGLIADKMLCIGPATLGIPLGKNKEAQRLKHVFDVALLSRHDVNPEEMKAALATCMKQENELQRSAWSLPEVISDTKKFLNEPLQHETIPAESTLEPGTYLDEIVRGFTLFRQHLFRVDYTWSLFREDCRHALSVVENLQ